MKTKLKIKNLLPDTMVWVGYYDKGQPITFYHRTVMDKKPITVIVDRPRAVIVRLINWEMNVIEKPIKLIAGLNTYTIKEWVIDPVIAELEREERTNQALQRMLDALKGKYGGKTVH